MLHDDNQKATKAHCRLAFSAQLQRFFLPLLVGLHGSTDTTARKSAIEEKMFRKVTLPSALIFCAKDVCTINFTVSFYLYCICNRVRSVSFSDGGLRDHDIQRWNGSCILFPLAAWLSFRHSKLTAGGEGRDFNSWKNRKTIGVRRRYVWMINVNMINYMINIKIKLNLHWIRGWKCSFGWLCKYPTNKSQ